MFLRGCEYKSFEQKKAAQMQIKALCRIYYNAEELLLQIFNQ